MIEKQGEPFPPDDVAFVRERRKKALISVGVQSIAIRLLIVFAELMGCLFFTSASLLFDAAQSVMDIAASLSLLFFIRIANKPPDRDHPLGHGRYEPIAGMQLAILMVLTGAALFGCQLFFLTHLSPGAPSPPPFLWTLPLAGVILLESAYRRLAHIAKKKQSPALMTEALHYRIDALSSFVAMLALAGGAFVGPLCAMLDHLGAAGIGMLMVILGCFSARQNARQLVDRVPEGRYFDLVRSAALQVQGVKATEKLRIQRYGPDAHVSIDVEVDPHLSVMQAHLIARDVRLAIQKRFPAVRDAIVHIEPHALDPSSLL